MSPMSTRGWRRLVATYSVNDVSLAARYELDPQVLIDVSGADRVGDLSPSNVSSFGHVSSAWFDSLRHSDARDIGFAHDLRGALERRQWLWLGEIAADDLAAAQERVGYGLLRQAGPARDGLIPVAMNPCAFVRHWLHGTDDQQRFMRWAVEGTDSMRVSRHDLAALRDAGVPIIQRHPLLRFLRSPKVIAYLVVLIYSSLRALPVMFVKEFHGKVWIIWAIDLITAIPYTWGIIAMVAARKTSTRILGVVVALTTFVSPYIYFWTHGRGYPWFVTVIVVGMIVAAIVLEGWRWLRDHVVARSLLAAPDIA